MSPLSLIVFAPDEKRCTDLCLLASETGRVDVAGRACKGEALAELVERFRPRAVLVDLDESADATLQAVEDLPEPRPLLMLAGPQDDPSLILRGMRLGAREMLPPDFTRQQLLATIEQLDGVFQPGPQERRPAPVVGVMGAKGGVGATVVACQLAGTLQGMGRSTVVVDLNLPLGDAALHFDSRPRYSLADVARQGDDFDGSYLKSITYRHSSGLHILASPSDPDDADVIRPVTVERTLRFLSEEFEWVVVDLPRSWDDLTLQALELADQIVLVTLLDVPTLNQARRTLKLLERLGIDDKIRLLANRRSSMDAVASGEVRSFLGRAPDARLPNDYPTVAHSVNCGRSIGELAPRSELSKAYHRLARELHGWCGQPVPEVDETHSLTGKLSDGIGALSNALTRRFNGAY
jgi:pilus assembly protein CpaE